MTIPKKEALVKIIRSTRHLQHFEIKASSVFTLSSLL